MDVGEGSGVEREVVAVVVVVVPAEKELCDREGGEDAAVGFCCRCSRWAGSEMEDDVALCAI